MKTSVLSLMLILLSGGFISAQPIPTDSLYLGQTPPGNTPVRFNLFVNTGSFAAERIAISGDGKEIYYSEVHSYYPTAGDTIKYYKYSGGHWTGPFKLFQGYIAPGLSITGDTMYFQNNSIPYQTLFSVRNGTSWSNPQRILYNLNSAHYLQETNNGNYYVSSISNPGIGGSDWCKLHINGSDTTAVSLGLPLNSNLNDLDLFVAKDESFMIVAKYAGYVTSLYISYYKSNGDWTNPKSLGPTINFGLGAWGPYVSSDNKYLFYTAGTNPNYSDTYIYWVRVDNVIDSLMHTNFVPYVKNPISSQSAAMGELFTFTIPDTTFIDDDGNNTLTYHAKLTSGNPLPAWLAFDTITGTFAGTPSNIETLNIWLSATDTAGASASTTFKITVTPHTSIEKINGKNDGVMIFPNPTNGLVTIALDKLKDKLAVIELYSIKGEIIQTNTFKSSICLDLTTRPGGIYFVKVLVDSEILIGKICVN
ncbi:MAG: putative Ig domain-containing protein [Bacteroidetes bacterium]|nr:putative Ig domain-containing protein [Bacteroidota bacterium]